jgi:uroporphyrinogen decarboxylase
LPGAKSAERTPAAEPRAGDVDAKRAALDLRDAPFLRACRREPTEYTPVWLMRQAGRYMQEYRELRARVPFIEMCKRPELAAEAAVTAARRLGTDAAILFSDILLIVEPMGLDLDYVAGEGPSIGRIVRSGADVDRLARVDPRESLAFVMDAVRLTRRELDAHLPLIGFSGAPFTLASYVIEGGGSRSYAATKAFMYGDAGAWHALMELIADAVAAYLVAQVEAGCQAVQLFDSWVGCLAPVDYERYVLRHTKRVFDALPAGVPAIHFGTDTACLLDLQLRAGGTVLGVDHRVPIADAIARYGDRVAIQGNLDPTVLLTEPGFVRAECARILSEVAGKPGHVFNLGHGILPATPVDNVIALVDAVHELSARGRPPR